MEARPAEKWLLTYARENRHYPQRVYNDPISRQFASASWLICKSAAQMGIGRRQPKYRWMPWNTMTARMTPIIQPSHQPTVCQKATRSDLWTTDMLSLYLPSPCLLCTQKSDRGQEEYLYEGIFCPRGPHCGIVTVRQWQLALHAILASYTRPSQARGRSYLTSNHSSNEKIINLKNINSKLYFKFNPII